MKKPVIRIDDQEAVGEYRLLLEEAMEILGRNGYLAEEAMVRSILNYLESDGEVFACEVTGTGIWGGSGSVSDCNFRGLSKANPDQARQDQKRLDELLGLLAKRLKKDGMVNPRIESLGAAYEGWARGK